MNSIIGYFLAILVVNVFSSDCHHFLGEPKTTVYGSFNFGYARGNNSFLLMEITLKNISPSVTSVNLVYKNQPCFEPERVKVNIENKTSEIKFMIQKHIGCNHILVDVQLYRQLEICDIINIAEGRDETTLTSNWEKGIFYYTYPDKLYYQKHYHVNDYCLALKPCEIVMDLKNKCEDRSKRMKTTTVSPVTELNLNNSTFKFNVSTSSHDNLGLTNNAKTTNHTFIIIGSLCGVTFTLLAIIAIWKCCIKHSPQGTTGLPTNHHNEPFYLNMLFRRECDQEIAEIDQHQYEEITPKVSEGG